MFARLARWKTFLSKTAWQHGLGLQICIWTNHKTSRTTFFEQTRPKWSWLAIMHSATFGENLKSLSAQTPHSKCYICWWRADDFGSSVYQSILKSNVRTSARQLKQQDNDPKHTTKSTTERLKNKKNEGVAIASQSPELILTEMLWRELCINKWPQISINWSNVIKKSGPKFLQNDMRDW